MPVTPSLRGQFPTRPAVVTPPSRREKTVFILSVATIVLPPWMVGAWTDWALWITVALAAMAFAALFVPMVDYRAWPPSPSGRVMFARLTKFPLFWLGLAIFVYGTIAALNPSRVFLISGRQTWLETTPHAAWLPHGIITQFWPMNAWRALLMFAPAWLATCAVWIGLETERAWHRLLGVVSINGLMLALLGVVQALSGTRNIFWFYMPYVGNTEPAFFATFIYAGHAAAWMVLAFGATAALMDHRLRRRDPDELPRRWGWPALTAWVWLEILMVLLLTLGVFLRPEFWTLAAGGVLTICAWLWLGRWWRAGQKRRAALYALPALVFIALVLGSTAGAVWWWRQGSGTSLEVNPRDASLPLRYAIATTSAAMIQDEPLWGWGPGSFRYIAPDYLRKNPLFTDPARPSVLRYNVNYAHNDWVQILAEWGLAGASLFAAILGWWVTQVWRLRRILPGESWILLGSVMLIFAGAMADFPLYNPAVLIVIGVLLATAIKLGEISARPRPAMSKVVVACP